MKNLFTKISQVVFNVSNTIITLLAIASLFLLVNFGIDKYKGGPGNIFGYRPVIILTGSMEPTIKTKSMIIGKEVSEFSDIKEGDIITYHIFESQQSKMITHRVIGVDEKHQTFRTKGDAVSKEDTFNGEYGLPFDQVRYKIVYIFNFVAPVVYLIMETPKKFAMIIVLLIIIRMLWYILNEMYYDRQYEFSLLLGRYSI